MTANLQLALDLTEEMLKAARAEEWGTFVRMLKRRSLLLQPNLFAEPDAKRLLPELQALQNELRQVIAASRDKVLLQLRAARRTQVGASAYLDTAQGAVGENP